jgi:prophage maintenance system killer protein
MLQYIYIASSTAHEVNRMLGYDGALRDENLLESALAAPIHAAYYGEADIVEQAAILLERIAKNHPYIDGVRRVGT